MTKDVTKTRKGTEVSLRGAIDEVSDDGLSGEILLREGFMGHKRAVVINKTDGFGDLIDLRSERIEEDTLVLVTKVMMFGNKLIALRVERRD